MSTLSAQVERLQALGDDAFVAIALGYEPRTGLFRVLARWQERDYTSTGPTYAHALMALTEALFRAGHASEEPA